MLWANNPLSVWLRHSKLMEKALSKETRNLGSHFRFATKSLPVILSQVPVSGLVWAGRDLQCPDSLGLGVLFFLQAYHSSLWKEMNFSDNPEKSSGCSYPKLGCSTVPVSQAIQLILTLWGCPVPLFALLVLLWPTCHLQLHAFACPLVSLAHCVPLT